MKNKNIKYSLLFILLIIWILFLNNYIQYLLNSDISSELVLSNLLNQEKRFFSNNWYYSAEFRVLYMQLIFTPLFFLTNNWHLVRILGTLIGMLLLLLSYYFFSKQFDLKNYCFFSLLILAPISYVYFDIVLVGSFYTFYLMITFISLGLVVLYTKKDNKSKNIFFALNCVLAIFSGMAGLRQLLILYLPLCLTTFIMLLMYKRNISKLKEFNYSIHIFVFSIIITLFAIIGYIINSKILSKLYDFMQYNNIHFTEFSFEKLQLIINGWLEVFGYQINGNLFSLKSISFNLICMLLIFFIIYSVYIVIKNRNRNTYIQNFIVFYFLISVMLISVFYVITDMDYSTRYLLPISVMFIPVISLGTTYIDNNFFKKLVLVITIICSFLVSILIYTEVAHNSKTSKNNELITISNILLENNYYNGYATYWNANVLTELSNGEISVWNVVLDENNILQLDGVYTWLQEKSHKTTVPKDKIFILLYNEEKENSIILNSKNNFNILYDSNSFLVLGFNNYNELKEKWIK